MSHHAWEYVFTLADRRQRDRTIHRPVSTCFSMFFVAKFSKNLYRVFADFPGDVWHRREMPVGGRVAGKVGIYSSHYNGNVNRDIATCTQRLALMFIVNIFTLFRKKWEEKTNLANLFLFTKKEDPVRQILDSLRRKGGSSKSVMRQIFQCFSRTMYNL